MAKPIEQTVLFLCTGNYYRSRFAEIAFNAAANKMGLPWKASSSGLALERGIHNIGPIAPSVIETLDAQRINPGDAITRMPRPVTREHLQAAHRVIALQDSEHRPLLQERFPDWVDKVEYWDVDDRPGILGLIDREVMGLIARLISGGERQGPPEETQLPSETINTKTQNKKITLKVGRETAGYKGKGITTIFDTPLDEAALLSLAATLKQKCGTGGTVKNDRIEIQGDQRERVIKELEKLGYQVKRAGG